MADIRITWDPERMLGDWLRAGTTLDTTMALVTAVAVALFTDRTALEDDPLPSPDGDRRGWWGDHEAGEVHSGWPIGSRLWLIVREKQLPETRNRAEAYIRECIDPLVEIGAVSAYDLVVDWFAHQRLGAEITLYRAGHPAVAVRFERLWDEIIRPAPLPVDDRVPQQSVSISFTESFA